MSDPQQIFEQLQSISNIVKGESTQPSKRPSRKAEEEQGYLQDEKTRENLKDQVQDREERKKYANRISIFVILWLFCVLATIILSAIPAIPLILSDGVIFALLGTVTVNVIGLFFIVAKYLFYRPKQRPFSI